MRRSPRAVLALGVLAGAVGGAGAVPAGAAGCANEALRTELGSGFLPDCRAYEQVSPPYKEGFELFSIGYSHDGETAMLESNGAFAETEGDSEGGLTAYAARRTPSGWRTEPLDPPGASYPGQSIRAANADSGASLWQLHSRSQSPLEVELYERSPTAAWTPIGPLFSPAEAGGEAGNTTSSGLNTAIAAAADYRHVVFTTPASELDGAGHAVRWPFDATVGASPSLYEYSGTHNTSPTLVDVTGSKGSNELLSRCGAVLGSGDVFQGSTFNALSADGETIFFTPLPEDVGNGQCVAPEPREPAVAEVFARIGGGPASPRAAQTVDVSARSSVSCDATCANSVPADKLFAGASEDGSSVVFASTQALITGASEDTTEGDGAVAGGRGNGCASTTGAGGCNLYDYSLSTHALALIAGGAEVLGVARMSADGSHVYFVAKQALAATTGAGGEGAQSSPTVGQPNLYVYDANTRATVFIATLNPELDSEDWRVFDQRPVQASAGEGRFLLFTSRGVRLTRDDSAAETQLFEYDSLTGELMRVSKGEVVAGEQAEVERGEKGQLGYEEDGNNVAGPVNGEALAEGETFHGEDFHQLGGGAAIYVAPDGSSVAFASTGRLSPLAISAEQRCASIYQFRTAGAGAPLSSGRVSLISDGRDVQPLKGQTCVGAQLLAMDPSAENVLFSTADPLVSGDTDGLQRDIYDARIGGGFPSAKVPAACEGDACRGPLTPTPGAPIVATAVQLAGGNVRPPAMPRASVRILSHALHGRTLQIVLRASAAGRVVLSGRGLRTTRCRVKAGTRITVAVMLSKGAARATPVPRGRRLTISVAFQSVSGSKARTTSTIRLRS